ncbi:MAG: energy transducer TonB [Opitutae bacterium]|nr:energy transducer TonB [Opitutae bacterium]
MIEWPQPEPPPPSEDAIISGDNRRVDGGGGPPPPTQIDVPGPSIPGAFLVEIDNRVVSVSGTFTTNIPAYWGPGGGDGSRPSMGGGIIPAGLLDKPPRARLQASPQYPMAERSTGITGSVEVEFVVDETGVVQMPRVVRASHPAFAEPTLRAVEKWRFEPGRRDGQVVRFRMKVPVMFNIND